MAFRSPLPKKQKCLWQLQKKTPHWPNLSLPVSHSQSWVWLSSTRQKNFRLNAVVCPVIWEAINTTYFSQPGLCVSFVTSTNPSRGLISTIRNSCPYASTLHLKFPKIKKLKNAKLSPGPRVLPPTSNLLIKGKREVELPLLDGKGSEEPGPTLKYTLKVRHITSHQKHP